MLEWFGDIGGVLEFFKMTLGGFVSIFSSSKILSLLANRFYYWEAQPDSYKSENRGKRVSLCLCFGTPKLSVRGHRNIPKELA